METLVLDKILVQAPCCLNPVLLLETFKYRGYCRQARYKTNLLITYTPAVSTETAGLTAVGVTEQPCTDIDMIARAGLHFVSAVWRKASINVSKGLLSSKDWVSYDDKAPWLSAANVRGKILLSCTIQACIVSSKVPLERPERLIDLNTTAIVGPRLAGFSLCYYGETYPMIAQYGGQVINIDLLKSRGWSTSARYVRTPENQPYIVVRYGWYTFAFVYNSNSKIQGWYGNGDIMQTYDDSPNSNRGDKPHFFGSWAKIRGNTSWWCETRPDYFRVEGVADLHQYRPYAVLFLYYDYGDVDIFSSDFRISPEITPSMDIPDPGPSYRPGQNYRLTLNGFSPFLLGSAEWNPKLTVVEEKNKEQLIAWPTVRHDELRSRMNVVSCPDKTGIPKEDL